MGWDGAGLQHYNGLWYSVMCTYAGADCTVRLSYPFRSFAPDPVLLPHRLGELESACTFRNHSFTFHRPPYIQDLAELAEFELSNAFLPNTIKCPIAVWSGFAKTGCSRPLGPVESSDSPSQTTYYPSNTTVDRQHYHTVSPRANSPPHA